jgi:Zn finger protein HypA/HybF involved in hydrogenase expression
MHERRLFEELRRALDRASAAGHGARLVRARVWIGALSHLSEPTLRQAWPRVVGGGPAEGSELSVEVSSDPAHPDAASVVLTSVDLVEPEPGGAA